MKKIIFFLLIALLIFACSKDEGGPIENVQIIETSGSGSEPLNLPISGPCEDGMVGDFPCFNFDLISRIDLEMLQASAGNDSWGWTDPSTGKEYALMGLNNGTAFIDLSTPATPIYLGKLGSQSGDSPWRDIKVYNNYAFIVSEASGHGMQIFDLTELRNVTNPPVSFSASAVYNEFGNAHNIIINEDTGYAYAVGTSTYNGGPHFINIQDPLNPTAAGGYGMDSYSHDAQVITYNGPDTDYQGKEILIGSNENEIVIVDITDKSNPEQIYREFQVSKKAFRRALGLLYSGKKITINPTTINMVSD
jgi:choice-of-anchor B domain-containing protein